MVSGRVVATTTNSGSPGFGSMMGYLMMPEMAPDGFVDDLVVGDGGLELAVPVDQAVAAVNEAVGEQAEEGLPDGPGADGVHGEALPLPIAGAAHALLLADDAGLVLVLPGPDPGDEGFPAEVAAGFALELEQPFFDDRLGGDAGVVGSRHPQGVVPGHPVPADEEVLHDVVHGVAHMKGPGDIGQGHHDDVAAGPSVGDGGESVGLEPAFGDPALVLGRLVEFRDLIRHGRVLQGRSRPLFLP